MEKVRSGSNCPQVRLPQSCSSNLAMRRMFTVAFSVVGLVLLFVGSIMMLVGGIGIYDVPAEDFCSALGYDIKNSNSAPDCSNKDQNFATPCCRGSVQQWENSPKLWAMPASSSGGTFSFEQLLEQLLFSQRDNLERGKTFFENMAAAVQDNRMLPGYSQSTIQNYKNVEGIYAAAKKQKTNLAYLSLLSSTALRKSINYFDNGPTIVAGGFAMAYCLLVLLNLTCMSRKGFALYNLAIGAAVLALIVLGMRQAESSALTTFAVWDFVPCSSFDSYLYNYNNQGATVPMQGPVNPGTISFCRLFGQFACLDVQCWYSQGQGAMQEQQALNPVLAWPIGMLRLIHSGGIVSLIGMVILAGLLANIGDTQQSEDELVGSA
jgi:hypothetical protein